MISIPYGRQEITQDDIDAVTEVMRSKFLTQGNVVPRFENLISTYCNAKHGIAVNSATSALHIACIALGVSKGDVVWTSPISFVASANCALFCGADIDFVDIDCITHNMSVDKLKEKLLLAEKIGRLPKVVIPVHLAGQSCDMIRIYELGQKYGFKIIEDASHAIGGKYKQEPIGNCRYSDITVFSFHPVKIITTAEGGIAVTNNDAFANKMSLLRSHGITRDASQMTCQADGPWYYQQLELGFNYRMTEMQAALGISQMDRLDSYIGLRHELSDRYDELLKDLPVNTPSLQLDNYSAIHLYIIRLCLNKIVTSRRRIFEMLQAKGIGVNVHYMPIHLQPFYKRLGFKTGDFPQAELYYSEAISLPMYPTLTYSQQNEVISALKYVLE